MRSTRANLTAIALVLTATLFAPLGSASASDYERNEPIVVAQDGTRGGELSPRYEPVERRQSSYNNEYIFALTRSVGDSTMHPAAKVPLFLFTVPLDIAVFPIEVLAGFF